MSGREGENNSDDAPPEEFTSQQGIEQYEEINQSPKGKLGERKWAQKLTPRPSREGESIEDAKEIETKQESHDNKGMLPDEIVKLLVASENRWKVFSSDAEEENPKKKSTSGKKKTKKIRVWRFSFVTWLEPIILEEIPTVQCLQSSLEFLK